MKTFRKAAIATLTVAIVATTSATGAFAGKGGGGYGGGGHGGGYVGDGNYMAKFKKNECEVRTVKFYVAGKGWVKELRQFCN